MTVAVEDCAGCMQFVCCSSVRFGWCSLQCSSGLAVACLKAKSTGALYRCVKRVLAGSVCASQLCLLYCSNAVTGLAAQHCGSCYGYDRLNGWLPHVRLHWRLHSVTGQSQCLYTTVLAILVASKLMQHG